MTTENCKITISGTFNLTMLHKALLKYKKGELDEIEFMMYISENAEVESCNLTKKNK